MKPKIGKIYIFVRKKGDGFEHTNFARHDDGSAEFVADGFIHIFECHADAWKEALTALKNDGFVEMREAKKEGIIPIDWNPTQETSTTNSSGPIQI
jgi:hypothetical protein